MTADDGGESGGGAADPNLTRWLKQFGRWLRDFHETAATLRQVRGDNQELRRQVDQLEKAVAEQTGQLKHLDELVQLRVKEEVERQLDRRGRS
jgi:hypothetical protein